MNARSRPNYQGIGAPLRRVEDRRFLLGRGRFVADIELPGALACVLVRSPHAHARIRGIDTAAATASPGVVAVFTGADMAADGIGADAAALGDRARATARRWRSRRALRSRARTVRHVGEPVAAVIAETLAQATDAAERVAVDYEPLAGRHRRARRAGAGRAAVARVRARQRLLPLGARRRGRGARGVRIGRPRGRDRSRQQPPGRSRDRAARGRSPRPSRMPSKLTLYTLDPGAPSHPPPGDRAARHPRERAARGLARCRRRLRLQGQALSGGGDRRPGRRAGCAVRCAGSRPAAESFVVGQPGPRSPDPRRACARCRRSFPGAARRHHRQSRRLCVDLRRRHSERDLQRACSRAAIARLRSSSR